MLPSSNPVVLVADDEPSMLELVSRHLRTMDDPKLEVLEASDGEQAWSLAREHLPDLVVLDVMMPGMSGWEVCRKIREDVALAHTGVVMLTGIGENLNQMTSPLYGADAYIDKPFEFEELDEKVKNALSARAAQRDAVARPVTTTVNGVSGPAQPAGKKAKASAKKSGRASAKKSASKSANKTAKKAAAKGARRTATKTAGRKGAANKPAAKKTTAKTKAGAKVTSTRKPQRGDTTMAAKKSAKKAAKKSTGAKKTAKKTAKKKAK